MPPITVVDTNMMTHPAETLILTMAAGGSLDAELDAVNAVLDNAILDQLESKVFKPTPEALMVLPTFGRLAAMHVVIVGLGAASRLSATGYQRGMVAAIDKAYHWGGDDMATVLPRIGGTRYFAEVVTALATACEAASAHLRRMDVILRSGQDINQIRRLLADVQS